MPSNQRVKISPNSFVIYRSNSGNPLSDRQLAVLRTNWSRVEYNGFMSKNTRKKIVMLLNTWAESIYAHHKLADDPNDKNAKRLRFLTLTLNKQQTMTDNEIKRQWLMPFIANLKRMFHVEHYFWRAEAQKNGNIHFHLIIDAYVDKDEVAKLWDLQQATENERKLIESGKQTKHSASTRIEAIQGTGAVAGYVTKYVTKDEGGRKIFGRIWGCSDSLRNMEITILDFTNEVASEITQAAQKSTYNVEVGDYIIRHRTSILRGKEYADTRLRAVLVEILLRNYDMLYKWKQIERQI